ncbi:hypothetical protein RchiOBHm_Chr2g0168011 [Rosa chinensis]|uniref:Uncharacterized protein n=1 Tax=Rosa chinensis TaxID=74649 RepID=A0A2P6S4H6_ROSCH|nr:hypothetical protein RchiOBHm_Chr2g0168011 [Rosa chinensis]
MQRQLLQLSWASKLDVDCIQEMSLELMLHKIMNLSIRFFKHMLHKMEIGLLVLQHYLWVRIEHNLV